MATAPRVHGAGGLAGVRLPPQSRLIPVAAGGAVEALIQASRAYEGSWLLGTAPLTNVALAMRADPRFTARLAGISWMGGSAGSGNVTAAAEFNCYVDPEAAAEVLAGVRCPLFMSGLDVTNRFAVDAGHAAELDAIPGAATGLVADVARRYLATYGDHANAVPARPPRRRARTGSATSTPWRRAGCCLPRAGSIPDLWVHRCVAPQFADARPQAHVPRAFAIPRALGLPIGPDDGTVFHFDGAGWSGIVSQSDAMTTVNWSVAR